MSKFYQKYKTTFLSRLPIVMFGGRGYLQKMRLQRMLHPNFCQQGRHYILILLLTILKIHSVPPFCQGPGL